MVRAADFDTAVALPPGLNIPAVKRSIEYIERELFDFIELYYEQANVFSSVVGIYGTRALDATSIYEKSRHLDTAQQRFPDLKRRGSGESPPPELSLESKASKRPWALQAHYDHPGWYIVWRYLVDPTEALEPGHPIIVWRVDRCLPGKKRLGVPGQWSESGRRRLDPHFWAEAASDSPERLPGVQAVGRSCVGWEAHPLEWWLK